MKLNLNVFSLLKMKQGHPISHKFESLSIGQAVFDAHPANFYHHAIKLNQTSACIFQMKDALNNADLLPFVH